MARWFLWLSVECCNLGRVNIGYNLAILFAFVQCFWSKVALRTGRTKTLGPMTGVRTDLVHDKPGVTSFSSQYWKGLAMSRVCQVTGKRPVTGNNVSHAKNRTKRRFLPNLHKHRFWVEAEKRFVSLRVSAKGMRIIDKKGIEVVLADVRARGEKV